MKIAKLLHNPTAGDEEHSEDKLVAMIEKAGFKCRYSSTKKKGWKEIEKDTDILVIAGGDGTVRKVANELLDRKLLEKQWPLALLPLGTANNIATTLGLIEKDTSQLIQSWSLEKLKKYDVGVIKGSDEKMFFLESFGYGIFPYLMMEMKKRKDDESPDPQERLHNSLSVLYQIVKEYEPRYCELKIDGTDHSGEFLLAEVMNTRTLGPNLCLSPLGDPGDGELEVVMVPANQKDKFAGFVANKIKGNEDQYSFHTLRGKHIHISWQGTHVHVDDELLKLKEAAQMKIEVIPGLLQFLMPLEDSIS